MAAIPNLTQIRPCCVMPWVSWSEWLVVCQWAPRKKIGAQIQFDLLTFSYDLVNKTYYCYCKWPVLSELWYYQAFQYGNISEICEISLFINIRPVITDLADVDFYNKLRSDLSKLTFPDELFEYQDNCDDHNHRERGGGTIWLKISLRKMVITQSHWWLMAVDLTWIKGLLSSKRLLDDE